MEALLQFTINEKRRTLDKIEYLQERYENQKKQAQVLTRILQRPINRTRDMAATEDEIARAQERLKQIEERLQNFQQAGVSPACTPLREQEALQVLGLSAHGLTNEKLKEAYRKLAKMHHPDAGGNNEKMAKINKAYEVASQVLGRHIYKA